VTRIERVSPYQVKNLRGGITPCRIKREMLGNGIPPHQIERLRGDFSSKETQQRISEATLFAVERESTQREGLQFECGGRINGRDVWKKPLHVILSSKINM